MQPASKKIFECCENPFYHGIDGVIRLYILPSFLLSGRVVELPSFFLVVRV